MFKFKPVLTTKIVLVVTFIVSLGACSSERVRLGEGEKRIIPQSEFGPGESWRDEDETPQYAATKESFRARVKKSGIKSRKSQVASGR
jgi:hypothetical protein